MAPHPSATWQFLGAVLAGGLVGCLLGLSCLASAMDDPKAPFDPFDGPDRLIGCTVFGLSVGTCVGLWRVIRPARPAGPSSSGSTRVPG